MSTTSDLQGRDLLDSITTRLQRGDAVDQLMEQSEEAQGDVGDIVEIIQSLHTSLTPRRPTQEFADSLRSDLLNGRPRLVSRVGQMPARLSFAAILAVLAGCVLLLLRRLFGSETAHDVPEEAVAAPL